MGDARMTKVESFCSNCGKSGHLAGACRTDPGPKRSPSKFEKDKISDQGMEHLLRDPLKTTLENCCKLVVDASLSTGHADTLEDLITELIWQAKEDRPCKKCEQHRTRNRERQQKSRLSRLRSASN